MHNFDIRNINLGQIKYFIEIVECNSFTKAAERLHISQSTISKNLASLESMLGLILFIREKKSIHVTPAGKYLYENWKQLIQQIDENIKEAFQIQLCNSRSLSVGTLDSFNPDLFIIPAIENFKIYNKDIGIRVENSPAQDIARMLLDNELDVAFTILYDIELLGEETFNYILLGECPHMVCMLKSNPLSKVDKLYVRDLASSNFIGISPLQTPSYTSMLTELCKPFGFTPNFTCFTASANSLALNLISDKDIFICDKFFRDFGSSHLCVKPLENTKSGFVIAWKKDNKNKLVDLFVKKSVDYFSDLHSKMESE